ncbi:phototropin-1B-like [Cryptomeria japonica]|uniref:phototropin-1B-like n=1 Tax=Cryptomeria japonica TaxID=3369 RepID=UPI0027DA4E31|nr:phototropin-1B-like [Cryptomeria japonica]
MAATHGYQESIWLKRLCSDVGFNARQISICCNNQSATCLAKHPTFHARTKHVDVQYYFVRDMVENGKFNLEKVDTLKNVPDALTKPVNTTKFQCPTRLHAHIKIHEFDHSYFILQTKTHICLVTDYCPGGELFMLIDRQPTKVLQEDAVRFYAAEVVVALEYLHCQGIIYRDLKPENVLIQRDGHVMLTDFDLSCLTSCKPQVIMPMNVSENKKGKINQPMFIAEPIRASNSFVGTEEYIAPEIINGAGHSSAVDWWALGVLLYEMLYGYTPFRGKTRQKTFANILHKDIKFSKSAHVSVAAIHLIHGLLHRDPAKRLGSCTGANEIKKHPFFRDVNWALVRSTKPPKLDVPMPTIGENVDNTKAMSSDWSEREALLAMHSSVF